MSEQLDPGVETGRDPAETPTNPTPFPAANPQNPGQDPGEGGEGDTTDIQVIMAELKRARDEAAKSRIQARDLKKKLSDYQQIQDRLQELEDAGKSEEEKLRTKLARLEKKQAESAREAEQAMLTAKLITLAAKAGVDPDLVAFLDASKLDLEDEEATIELLKKLAPGKKAQKGGGPSNPDTERREDVLTEEQLVDQYFRPAGRGINFVFGGNE